MIELMVTVAIIAILASIALPSYRDYVLRGQIVDATTELSSRRAEMERHFQDNRKYTSQGEVFISPCAPSRNKKVGSFNISCSQLSDSEYTAVAEGTGSTSGFVFTITHQGTRATTGAASGWCKSASVWVMRRGEGCS